MTSEPQHGGKMLVISCQRVILGHIVRLFLFSRFLNVIHTDEHDQVLHILLFKTDFSKAT